MLTGLGADDHDAGLVALANAPQRNGLVGIAQAHAATPGDLRYLLGVNTRKAKAPRERGLGWWLGD